MCSVARLIIQMSDLRWETQVEGAGIKLNLCIRYMDDGKIFLQPIRRGRR